MIDEYGNYKKYNTRVKIYPTGERKATIASRPIFKEDREVLEIKEWIDFIPEKVPKPKNKDNDSRNDSVRRAKSAVFDIVAMNEFTHFVTLTLSDEYIDRTNISAIRVKLSNFLSNNVQRKNLKYVLIPEFHHDGKSIHFHGFFSGDINYIDSGTVKTKSRGKPIKLETAIKYGIPISDCKTVYNIPSWRYGFSTALEITDTQNISKYVTKYITKESSKIFGKFYFAGGHDLVRKVPKKLLNVPNPHTVKAEHQSYCEFIDCNFKYLDSSRENDKEEMEYLGI